jgi:hypothetical protein
MVLLASSYDQSKYLKAEDLTAEKRFRIKEVTEELIGAGNDQEKKLVVWFANDERGLVLNRTNNRILRGAFGDPVDGWRNKVIAVYPTQVDFRGRMRPGLRVRIPPPKQGGKSAAVAKPSPAPDPELEPEKEADDDFDDEVDL